MKPRLKVAVFGCGRHGREHHVARYAQVPEVELVAVVDPVAERARECAETYGGAWFTDHREALAATSPELVSIVSPPVAHCEQALDCYAAGAHVLCEKPIAMNLDEARRMVDAAERAGKFLSMGLQSRYLESGRLLKRFLADGKLGEVFYTRAWTGHIMHIPGWGHFLKRETAGGGVVMSTAVHLLDFLLWVLGSPRVKSVSAMTHARLPHMSQPAITWDGTAADCEIEDFAYATLRFENGSWLSLESNWLTHPSDRPSGAEILGNDGRAWLHPLKIELSRGREVEDITPVFVENEDCVGGWLLEAIRCAREGGEVTVRSNEILQTQAVMDAIYRSAASGREEPVGM